MNDRLPSSRGVGRWRRTEGDEVGFRLPNGKENTRKLLNLTSSHSFIGISRKRTATESSIASQSNSTKTGEERLFRIINFFTVFPRASDPFSPVPPVRSLLPVASERTTPVDALMKLTFYQSATESNQCRKTDIMNNKCLVKWRQISDGGGVARLVASEEFRTSSDGEGKGGPFGFVCPLKGSLARH